MCLCTPITLYSIRSLNLLNYWLGNLIFMTTDLHNQKNGHYIYICYFALVINFFPSIRSFDHGGFCLVRNWQIRRMGEASHATRNSTLEAKFFLFLFFFALIGVAFKWFCLAQNFILTSSPGIVRQRLNHLSRKVDCYIFNLSHWPSRRSIDGGCSLFLFLLEDPTNPQ